MTHDRDFKRIVRARMATTGENYTQARTALTGGTDRPVRTAHAAPPENAGHLTDAEFAAARVEHQRVVGRFFEGERLRSVPTRRKVRVSVLLELLARFTPHRDYSEVEVNEVLRPAHEDVAYLRRELVNHGYLVRADGVYRVTQHMPERAGVQLQEIPAWERAWLPGFLQKGRP